MFGLSFGELAIIAILALLLLGPDRLPEAAKTLAKGLKELRKATDDLKDQLGNELNVVEDVKRTVTDALTGAVADATSEKPATALPPRGPPPSADAGNVPGLEAALVEAAPQVVEPSEPSPPAAPPSAPGGGKP